MQYSPKLKMAMEEIKATLNKYDIAGFCVIHTPGFSEYLNKIDPSYSILKINDGKGITFNAHSKHFGGDKQKRDQAASDTRNMILLFKETAGHQFMMYDEIGTKVDDTFGKWDHDDLDHSSHSQQNS